MKRSNLEFIIIVFLGLATLVTIAHQPSSAQGKLSVVEEALIDRAFTAARTTDEIMTGSTIKFNNYEAQYNNLHIGAMGVPLNITNSITEIDATGNFIRGDKLNGSALISVIVYSENYSEPPYVMEEYSPDKIQVTDYTLEAEVRYVDDVLYVNATYVKQNGEAPVLPEGWVVVDDPSNFPEFEALELDKFLNQFRMIENLDWDELQHIVEQNATKVVLDKTELFEIPVDIITIHLNWRGMNEILQAEDNKFLDSNDPLIAEFLENELNDYEDIFAISFALDQDEYVRGISMGTKISLKEPVIVFEDVPNVMTSLNTEMVLFGYGVITDVNPELELLEPPQIDNSQQNK